MRTLAVSFSLLAAIALSACGPRNPEAEAAAIEAAEAWLARVDNGQYAESWDAAAAYFKGGVTQDAWVQSMEGFRQPLGELESRSLRSARYRTSVPGAPDGEYVVIEFRTAFTRNQSAVETVTPMKDADGVWRVSGYFIR